MLSLEPGQIFVPEIVRAELLFGALKSNNPKETTERVNSFLRPLNFLAFQDEVVSAYARIRHELEKIGMPIGPNDLLIAATALAHDLILVTHNVREFSRVSGLETEDWCQ